MTQNQFVPIKNSAKSQIPTITSHELDYLLPLLCDPVSLGC